MIINKAIAAVENTWNSCKIIEIEDSVAIIDSISSFKALIWYVSELHTKKSS